jgi:uncharacterized membrane protein
MQNPASLSGHPVHPSLITLPVGLWAFSLFCDLLYVGGLEAELWSNLALFAMVGGFVGALIALVLSGFVDLEVAGRPAGEGAWASTYLNVALIVVALYGREAGSATSGSASTRDRRCRRRARVCGAFPALLSRA